MKRLALSLILTLVFSSTIWAQSPDGAKQRKVLRTAQLVLEEIQNSPDHEIPGGLISKAKAIIVFPTMVKAGFFIGARYGKGVASMRSKETEEWGAPAFLYTAGGSFGFQFGAEAVDLILLVMTQRGLEGLLSEKFTLGGDIAVSAGSVRRCFHAGRNLFLFQKQGHFWRGLRERHHHHLRCRCQPGFLWQTSDSREHPAFQSSRGDS